jgi:hypothetical protein
VFEFTVAFCFDDWLTGSKKVEKHESRERKNLEAFGMKNLDPHFLWITL